MILFLDKTKFRYDECITGEVGVTGENCKLVLVLLARERISFLRNGEVVKRLKNDFFNEANEITEKISSFENHCFPFNFRVPSDSPSSFNYTFEDDGFKIHAVFRYKVKAMLVRGDKALETCSKVYEIIGKPFGKENYSIRTSNFRPLPCFPLYFIVQIELPSSIKVNEKLQNFRVSCKRIPANFRVLSISGKIVYKCKVKSNTGKVYQAKTVLHEDQSSGEEFCKLWTIDSAAKTSSYRSSCIKSKFYFLVIFLCSFCCFSRRFKKKYVLNVEPEDEKETDLILNESSQNFTVQPLKTMSIKSKSRVFKTSYYRKTAVTDSDSLIFNTFT